MLKSLFKQKKLLLNKTVITCSSQIRHKLLTYSYKMNYSSTNNSDNNISSDIHQQLTEEQIQYINSLSNLEDRELIKECSNLQIKPNETNRQYLIQTIKDTISIKNKERSKKLSDLLIKSKVAEKNNLYSPEKISTELNQQNVQSIQLENSTKKDEASIEEQDIEVKNAMKNILTMDEYTKFIEQYHNPYAGNYSEKNIDIDRQFQLQKTIEQSDILNGYQDIINYTQPNSLLSNEQIDDYSLDQQQKYIQDKPQVLINKQIQNFSDHSKFINENDNRYSMKGKLTKLSKQDNPRFILSQMISIENEYNHIYQCQVKKFLQEITNSQLDNNKVINLTNTLSDPIKFWNYASLFQYSSSLAVNNIWKVLTENVECNLFIQNKFG